MSAEDKEEHLLWSLRFDGRRIRTVFCAPFPRDLWHSHFGGFDSPLPRDPPAEPQVRALRLRALHAGECGAGVSAP